MGRNGALGACAALALGAGAARGQTTAIVFDASLDYVNWSAAIDANPGDTVYVRMRVRLDGATALGLAGISCQPTLTSWNAPAGDVLMGWTSSGGGAVPFEPYNTGKIRPFGSGTQTIVGHVDGGLVLRIADERAVPPNQALWGVGLSQSTPNLSGTNFNTAGYPITFVYEVQLGDAGERWMVADAPAQYVANGRATWYMQSNGLNSMNSTVDGVETATIHVAPAPGVLGLGAGLGMLATPRRRGAP